MQYYGPERVYQNCLILFQVRYEWDFMFLCILKYKGKSQNRQDFGRTEGRKWFGSGSARNEPPPLDLDLLDQRWGYDLTPNEGPDRDLGAIGGSIMSGKHAQ